MYTLIVVSILDHYLMGPVVRAGQFKFQFQFSKVATERLLVFLARFTLMIPFCGDSFITFRGSISFKATTTYRHNKKKRYDRNEKCYIY